TKRTIYRQSLRSRAGWLGGLLAAYLFMVVGRRLAPLNALFVPHVPATMIAAAAIAVIGLLFTLWARVALGANWSGRVTLKEDHQIIVGGPYRIVRHPIYTGILTM